MKQVYLGAILLFIFLISCTDQPTSNSDKLNGSLSKGKGESSTYVLVAGKWKSKQDNAVRKAGGEVTFSHEKSGIGVATSSDPDFLSKVKASGAFSDAGLDQEVQWQDPMETVNLDASSVTPEDETFYSYQWNMKAIDAEGAWAAGYTGAGVRVAVLDGGITPNHGDIAPNLDVGASASFVPGTSFYEDNPGFRHATHVAGIVAAPDNNFGTIGVAPGATIIGVKVLHYGSGAYSWILQGILYAATPQSEGGAGADIINMSLRGYFPKSATGGGQLNATFNRVVNYASQQGVLVISAAGNDGFNWDQSWEFTIMPAEAGNGIAVSATGPTDFISGGTNFRRFASYSNSGHSLVHVAAPGGDFASAAGYPFDMVLSPSYVDGNIHYYSFAAGTSMAAPAAAGVAALIKEKYPNISVGAWKNKLANSADDEGKSGHDEQYGRGFVNAYRAVTQ